MKGSRHCQTLRPALQRVKWGWESQSFSLFPQNVHESSPRVHCKLLCSTTGLDLPRLPWLIPVVPGGTSVNQSINQSTLIILITDALHQLSRRPQSTHNQDQLVRCWSSASHKAATLAALQAQLVAAGPRAARAVHRGKAVSLLPARLSLLQPCQQEVHRGTMQACSAQAAPSEEDPLVQVCGVVVDACSTARSVTAAGPVGCGSAQQGALPRALQPGGDAVHSPAQRPLAQRRLAAWQCGSAGMRYVRSLRLTSCACTGLW